MAEKNIERLIGIDFGTSTSIVKCKRYQDGKPLGNAHHVESVTFGSGVSDPKAITLVRINPDGTASCGIDAEEEIDGSRVYREFKMELESEDAEIRGRAMELTEEYLKYLYRRYSHQQSDLGEKSDEISTIISFPAKWQKQTREFMVEVARDAGFPNVSAMDEPSAALFAVLCRKMDEIKQKNLLKKDKDNLILIIDMGAGTTDLAVCKCSINAESDDVRAEDIKNEVVVAWPDSSVNLTFGGREIDVRLRSFLVDYLCDCNMPREVSENIVGQSTAVKSWKENTLSSALGNNSSVKSCSIVSSCLNYFPGVSKKPFPELTRESFEELISDKIDDYKALINGCLDKLNEDDEIDIVILTGGHSSWYFTSEIIEGTIPGIDHPALKKVRQEKQRVMRLSNPQETVALGMVYSKLPFDISKTVVKAEAADADVSKDVPPLADTDESVVRLVPVAQQYMLKNAPLVAENEGAVQKLMKHLHVYAKQNAYLWQDTTWFGSGMNGWIIADDGFHFRSMWDTPNKINWRAFRDKLKIYCDEKNRIVLENTTKYCISLPSGKKEMMFNFLTGLQAVLKNVSDEDTVNIDCSDAADKPAPADVSSYDLIVPYVLMPSGERLQKDMYFPDTEEVKLIGYARQFINANLYLTDIDYNTSELIKYLLIDQDETPFISNTSENGDAGWIVTCKGISFRLSHNDPAGRIPWSTFRDMEILCDYENSSVALKLCSTGDETVLGACRNIQNTSELLMKMNKLLKEAPVQCKPEIENISKSANELCSMLSESFSGFNKAINTVLLKRTLAVPENEKVFFSFDSGFIENGKRGTVITERGIYASCRMGLFSNDIIHFTSWDELAAGNILYSDNSIVCVLSASIRRTIYDGSTNRVAMYNIYKQIQQWLKN